MIPASSSESWMKSWPSSPIPKNRKVKLLALVAPHIDLSVGGRVYSRAYQILRGRSPKTVIILGTGHQMAQDLFALSGKDFETPLGVAECDRAWVEKLKAAGGERHCEE